MQRSSNSRQWIFLMLFSYVNEKDFEISFKIVHSGHDNSISKLF